MNITNRTTHDCQQGSDAWLSLRAGYFTASEAPAMLGVSKYQTRSDLLKRKATGISADVDAHTQRRFDDGHIAEAAARPIVEGIIGEELFPVTMTAYVDGLPLLASMDGLTMLGDTGWETKLLNQELRADVEAGELSEHYTAQLEQQLMVSGADRIYFTTTDGTPENTFGMWYESNPALRERIAAGWKQFLADLDAYEPAEAEAVAPAGRAPEALPALRIEVTGMVTNSNIDAFRENAMAVLGSIKTDLQTDADFADAERTVKWAKEVEDKLDAAKEHALSQTASIDKLFKTIDAVKEEARAVRLKLDKLVLQRKEEIKAGIILSAKKDLEEHVAKLNNRIGMVCMPEISGNFALAARNKRSISSLHDAVDTELAKCKISSSEIADKISTNLAWFKGFAAGYEFLFPDLAEIIVLE